MKAAIITIGDEILIGQVINSNASFLSSSLFSIGIPVKRVITVPDESNEILKEFDSAFKTFDFIIVTGGLGPTHDDITKTCISKFFKSELITDEESLKRIKKEFSNAERCLCLM